MGYDVVPLLGRRARGDGRSAARGRDRPRLSSRLGRLPVRRVWCGSMGSRCRASIPVEPACRCPTSVRARSRSSSRPPRTRRFPGTGRRRSARSRRPAIEPLYRLRQAALGVRDDDGVRPAARRRGAAGLGRCAAARRSPPHSRACASWRPRSTSLDLDRRRRRPRQRRDACCSRRSTCERATGSHRVVAVGHAHIDSAWLWPIRETQAQVRAHVRLGHPVDGRLPRLPLHLLAGGAVRLDRARSSRRVRRHPAPRSPPASGTRSGACGSSPT